MQTGQRLRTVPAMTPEAFRALQGTWQNFYLLTGGAAATLAGLMFVAVTFGAGLVQKSSADSARAFIDPTFAQFLQVLLTGCVLVVPVLTPRVLGVLLVLAATVRTGGLFWVLRQFRRAHARHGDLELSDWLSAIVLPGLAYALLLASGVGFLAGRAEAFTGLAIVTIALLGVGVWSAWELLVWMAVANNARRDQRSGDDARPE